MQRPMASYSHVTRPQVVDQQTGAVFSGDSPTKPWTDVRPDCVLCFRCGSTAGQQAGGSSH